MKPEVLLQLKVTQIKYTITGMTAKNKLKEKRILSIKVSSCLKKQICGRMVPEIKLR